MAAPLPVHIAVADPASPPSLSWELSPPGSAQRQPEPGPFAPGPPPPRPEAPRLLGFQGYLVGRSSLASALGVSLRREDAELVAEALAAWGVGGALARLEGPCSWLAWDAPHQRLDAVVDRLGLHPLYWTLDRGRLSLARRAADLSADLSTDWEPDEIAVAAHLHGVAPPPGTTFFRHVQAVPPGSRLRAEDGGVAVHTYWRPGSGDSEPWQSRSATDLRDAPEALATLLRAVVEEHAAGERVGVTVSAGRDSTAVAAAWRHSLPPGSSPPALLWSLRQPGADDESLDAARVAEHLGLSPHVLPLAGAGPLARGAAALSSPDRPTALGFVEIWEASLDWAAARRLDVLLTGAGGDQVFGAGEYFAYADLLSRGRLGEARRRWRRQRAEGLATAWDLWRWWLRPLAVSLAPRRLTPFRPSPWASRRLRAAAAELAAPPSRGWLPRPAARSRREALAPALLWPPVADLAERAARRDVEVRHPLLDSRLVEWAATAPPETILWNGHRKGLLRHALADALPPEEEAPLRKAGLTPLWRRAVAERRGAFLDLLRESRAVDLGWLDPQAVAEAARRVEEHGEADMSLAPVLSLESWLRRHLPAG